MSLAERVQKAGNAVSEETLSEGALLERLRNELQEEMSVDKLASLSQSNPQQARNEVRSTARRIFSRAHWDTVGERQKSVLAAKLLDVIFGFGILEDLIADESITEIIANGPTSVFYEKDGKIARCDRSFGSEEELRALIDRILGPLGRRIDEASPMVDGRLPEGHRVNIVIPPIALNGPHLTIRKFSTHVITLQEMEQSQSIEPQVGQFLKWAVRARKSIAVSGGTGSGKTTLLNALSCEIPPEERIVTIEDSAELRFEHHPDVARLEARPMNAEGTGEVTIRRLVINALRMRPDRIVVGECRGAEALDMLQAMNTGHDGSLTTLHANSPAESISRLTTMVRFEADLPVDVIEANIASAIQLVVQTERSIDGKRRVCELVGFIFNREQSRCEVVPIYKRGNCDHKGNWIQAPDWINDLSLLGIASEQEVEQWKQQCFTS